MLEQTLVCRGQRLELFEAAVDAAQILINSGRWNLERFRPAIHGFVYPGGFEFKSRNNLVERIQSSRSICYSNDDDLGWVCHQRFYRYIPRCRW